MKFWKWLGCVINAHKVIEYHEEAKATNKEAKKNLEKAYMDLVKVQNIEARAVKIHRLNFKVHADVTRFLKSGGEIPGLTLADMDDSENFLVDTASVMVCPGPLCPWWLKVRSAPAGVEVTGVKSILARAFEKIQNPKSEIKA